MARFNKNNFGAPRKEYGKEPGRRDSRSYGRDRFEDKKPRRSESEGQDYESFKAKNMSRIVQKRDDKDRRKQNGGLDFHKVICARCGRETEVPFKPKGNKPVLCRECFNKETGSPERSAEIKRPAEKPEVTRRDIEEINRKLDRIMKALQLE